MWNDGIIFHDYQADFTATDGNGQAKNATYKARVFFASTTLSNNAGITQNATVTKGTIVNFTCTNSSKMYYGPSANPSLVASKYSGSSPSDYTLNYSIALNTVGSFKVKCENIGGGLTRKEMVFNVEENINCPTPGEELF